LSLVLAEIEKPRSGLFSKRCLTRVVLPDPEGAEKIITLPWIVLV
jgi:hypothetical protein